MCDIALQLVQFLDITLWLELLLCQFIVYSGTINLATT